MVVPGNPFPFESITWPVSPDVVTPCANAPPKAISKTGIINKIFRITIFLGMTNETCKFTK